MQLSTLVEQLATFLDQRLAYAERNAMPGNIAEVWTAGKTFGTVVTEDGKTVIMRCHSNGDANHAASYDPSWVVQDVAVKRRLLEFVLTKPHFRDSERPFGCHAMKPDGTATGYRCDCGRDDEVLRQLLVMVQWFAEHPQYQKAWNQLAAELPKQRFRGPRYPIDNSHGC